MIVFHATGLEVVLIAGVGFYIGLLIRLRAGIYLAQAKIPRFKLCRVCREKIEGLVDLCPDCDKMCRDAFRMAFSPGE